MIAFFFVWLFVFAVPWENVVVFPGLGTLSKMIGIAAFGVTGLNALLRARVRSVTSFHVIAFAFLCWVLLSISWAVNNFCSPVTGCDIRTAIETYLQIFVMLWVLWEAAPTRSRFLSLLQAYVLGAYVSALNTIYNYFIGAALKHAYGRFAAEGFDPNDLGMVLAFGLPMAWYISSRTSSAFQRWLNRGYFVAGSLAILLTGSRGAMLATIVALCVIPWTLTQVRRGVRIAAVVIMFAAGILAVRFVPERLFQRLSTTESEITEGSMNDRLQIWKHGIQAVPDRPLQGYGPAGWEQALSRRFDIKGAHNTYLAILVDEGLIGLTLYLLMFVALYRRLRVLPVFERRVALTLLATLATAIMPLDWDTRKAGWLILGLLAGWSDVFAPAPPAIGVVPATLGGRYLAGLRAVRRPAASARRP